MTGEDAAAFEAVVVGGGPAGAAASRLLSLWGHRVLVLTRRPPQDRPLPVSIPPSSRKLLDVLGVTEAVEDAGFQRSRGNTVWWGEAPTRCVDFPDGSSGFQVLLAELEGLLLEGSAEAGAEVRRDATVRSVDTGSGPARVTFESPGGSPGMAEATLVLDCSGRAGVVAAGFRIHDHANATVALCGLWRRPGGWGLTDETHTLVESYRDGWAWSIPTAPGVRFVTVMVDPRRTALSRGQERDRTYLAELDKTVRMRDLVQAARFDGDTWGHTASQYCAERYQGKSHLLVGDAASFIDPLSSFGVKKALASAWLAAVVANTAARLPRRRKGPRYSVLVGPGGGATCLRGCCNTAVGRPLLGRPGPPGRRRRAGRGRPPPGPGRTRSLRRAPADSRDSVAARSRRAPRHRRRGTGPPGRARRPARHGHVARRPPVPARRRPPAGRRAGARSSSGTRPLGSLLPVGRTGDPAGLSRGPVRAPGPGHPGERLTRTGS